MATSFVRGAASSAGRSTMTIRLIEILFMLFVNEPVWTGECTMAWEVLPCERHIFKEHVYGVIYKNGEPYIILEFLQDGTQVMKYKFPIKHWT